jgi:hypothetical protein
VRIQSTLKNPKKALIGAEICAPCGVAGFARICGVMVDFLAKLALGALV